MDDYNNALRRTFWVIGFVFSVLSGHKHMFYLY